MALHAPAGFFVPVSLDERRGPLLFRQGRRFLRTWPGSGDRTVTCTIRSLCGYRAREFWLDARVILITRVRYNPGSCEVSEAKTSGCTGTSYAADPGSHFLVGDTSLSDAYRADVRVKFLGPPERAPYRRAHVVFCRGGLGSRGLSEHNADQ